MLSPAPNAHEVSWHSVAQERSHKSRQISKTNTADVYRRPTQPPPQNRERPKRQVGQSPGSPPWARAAHMCILTLSKSYLPCPTPQFPRPEQGNYDCSQNTFTKCLSLAGFSRRGPLSGARRAAPPSAARVATGLAPGRDSGRRPWEPGRAASQVARYCFTSPAVDSETLAKKRNRGEGGPGLRSPSAEPAPRASGRSEEGAWARGGRRSPTLRSLPVPPTPTRARPRSPRPGSRSSQWPIVRRYVSRTPPKTRSFLLASRSGSGCPAPAPPQAPPSSSGLARSSRRGEQGRGRWPHRDTPPVRPAHRPGAPRMHWCAAADHLGWMS